MILDTNALSAWIEGQTQVLEKITSQPVICLPVIVLGEFRFGLLGSRKRQVIEPRLDLLEQTAGGAAHPTQFW